MSHKKEQLQSGPTLWGADLPFVAAEPFVPKREYLPIAQADTLSPKALEKVPRFTYKPLPEPLNVITYGEGTSLKQYGNYEILHTTPASNTWSAQGLDAPFIVSLSGGLGSAIAGERAIQKYGRDNVAFWFADVKKENTDLYRFVHDLMGRFGGRLYYYTDGRRPEDVWDKRKIIPNNQIAPCSYELKVKPFRYFIQAMNHMPVIYIGYKPGEQERMQSTAVSYKEAIPNAIVDYPLMWEPTETRDLVAVCEEELGIEAPLLYKLGYDYNNCGGECCRAGITSWVRTAEHFPQRFSHMEAWEAGARSQGDSRAKYTIAARTRDGKKQPLPLSQIKAEYLPQAETLYQREQTKRDNARKKLQGKGK
jgi:3'-phosphoadenosine 5'-phosphosulfate sulfotransferase (PAPS reductase)/FAD synthetase